MVLLEEGRVVIESMRTDSRILFTMDKYLTTSGFFIHVITLFVSTRIICGLEITEII